MDVKNMLRIPHCEIFRSSFNRSNLFYEVRQKSSNAAEVVKDVSYISILF